MTGKTRIDLEKYMFPSEKIQTAFERLDQYFQLVRANNKDNHYLRDVKMKAPKDLRLQTSSYNRNTLYLKHSGTPWEVLVKSIFLMSNSPSALDLPSLKNITPEQFDSLYAILTDGIKSFDVLYKWLEPLTNSEKPMEFLRAMYDALDISISAEGGTFKLVKIADLPQYVKKGAPVLYNPLLEVKDPKTVIDYLVTRNELSDQLMVTYWGHPDGRNSFTLFMVYDGVLYAFINYGSIKNMYYIGHTHDEKIHLPKQMVDRIKERAIIDPSYDVHQITTFDEVEKYHPDVMYWLDMFMIHAVYAIKRDKAIIKTVVTSTSQTPLLEDKTEITPKYKFKKPDQKNDYLEAILGNMPLTEGTDISQYKREAVLNLDTPENLADQRAYEMRRIYSKWMQDTIKKYHEANHERVYKEVGDLFRSKGTKWLVEKAVKHELHAGRDVVSEKFTDVSIDTNNPYNIAYHPVHEYKHNWLYSYNRNRVECPICSSKQWTRSVQLTFTDHRQILSFLGITEGELPKEAVNHFIERTETRSDGDIDPVQNVVDPWFGGGRRDVKVFSFLVVCCTECLTKAKKEHDGKVFEPSLENLENYTGWLPRSSRASKKHFWVSNPLGGGLQSICGRDLVQNLDYPTVGNRYEVIDSYKNGDKKTHCHHCVKVIEGLLTQKNLEQVNKGSYYVTEDMLTGEHGGWAVPSAMLDKGKTKHLFHSYGACLCGAYGFSGYRAHPKKYNNDDNDYRNCPSCLEALADLRKKGKLTISGFERWE